jgi:hypothetical protein
MNLCFLGRAMHLLGATVLSPPAAKRRSKCIGLLWNLSRFRLASLFCLAVGVLSSHAYAQKATLPTPVMFADGDTWEWRVVDQLTKIEEQRLTRSVVSENGTVNFAYSIRRGSGVTSEFTDGSYKSSAKPWRDWPLEVGKKWTMNADWTTSEGRSGNTRQDAEVVAYEEVNVPAGKFMAFKIEQRGWYTVRAGRGKQNDTYWYSPEALADVKHIRDDGYSHYLRELTAMKRGVP